MYRNHNSTIAQRYLSKNKKYYSYRTVRKDKQNIIDGDINTIIQKLTKQQNTSSTVNIFPKIVQKKQKFPLQILEAISNRKSLEKSLEKSCQNERIASINNSKCYKASSNNNCVNFFQQSQHEKCVKKQIKKQLIFYISKIKKPIHNKNSLYQQYLTLSQETNDYLEYYLTNFTGQDPGKATQLLKQQGKTIILLILRKKYKCFSQSNTPDIINRIFLTFKLNPLNDFQFISWQKFMRIRKLISGDFNRKDYMDFILDYFFIDGIKDKSSKSSKKQIYGSQFWIIFSSVLRKLASTLDTSNLQIFMNRIKMCMIEQIPEEQVLTYEKLQKIIIDDPMFIWSQFVTLAFA